MISIETVPGTEASPRASVPTIEVGDWITKDHAAVLLGVSTRTLDTMIKNGTAPAPCRITPKRVRYSEAEFRAWLASRFSVARVAGAGEGAQ